MTRRSRLLFVSRAGRRPLRTLLLLARAAREAGHLVAFAGDYQAIRQVRRLGLPGFQAAPSAEPGAALHVDDLEAVIAAWQPDLVLHDVAELVTPLVATAQGIPYVEVGTGPLTSRDALAEAATVAAPLWTGRRLEPDPWAGLFRYLYLDPCPPALQEPWAAAIPAAQLISPIAADEPQQPWAARETARPVVAVMIGPRRNRDRALLDLVAAALSGRATLVLAAGPVPDCDAVLTRCRSRTLLRALAVGAPVLALSSDPADRGYATHLERAGAGRLAAVEELTAATLRRDLVALLSEPGYRTGAGAVGAELRVMPAVDEAVKTVETLL